jgi:hypothetical protein
MSLKGPLAMHPPPLPAGFMPLLLCVTFSPWPLMLVSLPSKMGEVSGLDAHLPQSQYCVDLSVRLRSRARRSYRLSAIVPAFCPQSLLVCECKVSVPRKEVALGEVRC